MNEYGIIGTLAFASVLPYLVACGTCFIKFSIVFNLLRNAIGLQQVPSNLTLNGLALLLTVVVMAPIISNTYQYYIENNVSLANPESTKNFLNEGLGTYKEHLAKFADPDLVGFFAKAAISAETIHAQRTGDNAQLNALQNNPPKKVAEHSVLVLLPAYALSEINNAFKIGFYIYLPFLVVDLLVSNILLALGMMMMSPVTISLPIKLILFVAMDGWNKLVKGLITQYIDLASI